MAGKDMFSTLSKKQQDAFAVEAKERWEHTDAYRQSQERVKKLGQAGMEKVNAEREALIREIAAAMPSGVKSDQVQQLVKRHYEQLRVFYEPTLAIYRGLAEIYVLDDRFFANYEAIAPGLAQFMHDAMIYFIEDQT